VDELARASERTESLAEDQAETESMTGAELAIENVPAADEVEPLDVESDESTGKR